jgi:hypothetical protein
VLNQRPEATRRNAKPAREAEQRQNLNHPSR